MARYIEDDISYIHSRHWWLHGMSCTCHAHLLGLLLHIGIVGWAPNIPPDTVSSPPFIDGCSRNTKADWQLGDPNEPTLDLLPRLSNASSSSSVFNVYGWFGVSAGRKLYTHGIK